MAVVGLPSDTLYAPARAQLNRYLLFALAAVLLAAVAAVILARGIANPVRWLSLAAHRFGDGELATRATFKATGELEELRTSFNSMAEQIAGEINVESTPGRGSTFTLALPLWDNRDHFTNHGEQTDGQAATDRRR